MARLDIAIAFAGDHNFGAVVGIEAFDVDTELSLSGCSLEGSACYPRMSVLENVAAQLLEFYAADSIDWQSVFAVQIRARDLDRRCIAGDRRYRLLLAA